MRKWFYRIAELRKLDFWLLFNAVLLSVIGSLFIRSATIVRSQIFQRHYIDHLEFAALGLFCGLILTFWSYKNWIRFAPLLYFGILFLLILVLIPGVGTSRMGAQRWLFGIQPSEPAKIGVIVMLAYLLSEWKEKVRSFRGLCFCVAIAGVPAVLILKQPDLGTALVLGPTLFFMLFAANIKPKLLISGLIIGVIATGYVLVMVSLANKPGIPEERKRQLLNYTLLEPHQIKRVEVFLFPMRDLHGSGYNARQAEIGIGSGGCFGKGYMKGEQNMLGYLPASVSANDFIFPVIAEETGFVGSVVLICIFSLGILVPCLHIALRCADDAGKLLSIGITSLMFCHLFINIGMTVRLMPITGLPLPFISYGGTFMMTMMISMGIVQSVAVNGCEHTRMFKR